MKYVVRAVGKTYQVEIDDLNSRPILARVDGETFEVIPETDGVDGSSEKPKIEKSIEISGARTNSLPNTNVICAPLPGNITEIFIKEGDEVQTGQVILIIEAMKMKNSIRSTRAGKVAAVKVSAGQTIVHRQVLVEFS